MTQLDEKSEAENCVKTDSVTAELGAVVLASFIFFSLLCSGYNISFVKVYVLCSFLLEVQQTWIILAPNFC